MIKQVANIIKQIKNENSENLMDTGKENLTGRRARPVADFGYGMKRFKSESTTTINSASTKAVNPIN